MMNKNYESYLISEQKSEKTIRNYTNYVKEFFKFIGDKNDADITVEDVIKFKEHIAHQASATVAIKLNSLRNYFEYLQTIEVIHSNPMDKIKNPKVKSRSKEHMSTEDVTALISNARTNRDKAVIATVASTGLRMEEIASITMEQWNKMQEYDQRTITIIGKGDKERVIFFNDMAVKCIEAMLYDRAKKEKVTSGYLFETLRGNQLTDAGMNVMLKTAARKANLPYHEEISMHWLRAAFATIASDKGVPIAHISAAMGHSNIATTSRYIKTKQEDVNNVMNSMVFI